LSYAADGEKYWVSRGGFFQVNRYLVDELVRIVATGRHGALAWDLYAGVGLFSRALKAGFDEVVAVEAAADDLTKTFKGNGRHAVAATTVEFLRGAVVQRERPELVVMDPPRAGVGAEVCALLGRVGAKEMVYVSCDPVTLGRDLKAMVDFGYRINELHLVDLFPQTFHQETVVVLRRP
jgi:23S rRNA (uracil1939-C5)-methyltransferase